MSQMYRQSKALQEMVTANGDHVQGDSNLQPILKRIEEKLVSDQVKTDEMRTLLQYNRKLLVGIKSDNEKSQAILSFLATGESIPCPKLVVMILEKHVPEDKRQPRSFVKRIVMNPFKKRCYFFFLCQQTLKVVNPGNPMVLELGQFNDLAEGLHKGS